MQDVQALFKTEIKNLNRSGQIYEKAFLNMSTSFRGNTNILRIVRRRDITDDENETEV